MKPRSSLVHVPVARRVDLTASTIGFAPPPCPIHLKFLQLAGRWSLVILSPPGKPPAVARWLEAYQPSSIAIAPGLSPKVLRAHFDNLPKAWATLFSTVIVHFIELTPDGSASIFVEDSLDKIDVFVRTIQIENPTTRSRKTQSGIDRVRLTPRQIEVLALAVALGYYEVPHRLNLRALAKKLGLSVGAVSELLRRGESLIITHYVDSLSASRWAESGEPAPSSLVTADRPA